MEKTCKHQLSTLFFIMLFIIPSCKQDDIYQNAMTRIPDFNTALDQPPVPGNSGAISAASITTSSCTLNWAAATDDFTPAENLKYVVYKSELPDIDTAFNAELNGTEVITWTANLNSFDIAGLEEAKKYYFNVLVKDDVGPSAYVMIEVNTPDRTPPVPGNSGTITPLNIITHSLTLNWTKAEDNGTAQEDLKYIVYYADTASKVSSLDNAQTSGAVQVCLWTDDLSIINVSGLIQATTYYINVFVNDLSDNDAPYTVRAITTTPDGAPVPGSSGEITAGSITATGLTLGWAEADDNEAGGGTPQADLQYCIYQSSNPDIATVEDVFTQSHGAENAGWNTHAAILKDVAGLSEASNYYFNIFVRDEALPTPNISAYTMLYVKTIDKSPPLPGNGGLIQKLKITPSLVSLGWDYAGDQPPLPAGTPQAILLYWVNRAATAEEIDNWDEWNKGTQITPDWTVNINNIIDYNVAPNSTYFYNVFVKDDTENIAGYIVISITTLPVSKTIYMFATPVHNGNLGGRTGADELCLQVYNKIPDITKNQCTAIKALISINVTDTAAAMPLNYGVPPSWPVKGPAGGRIGLNWASLFDNNIDTTLQAAKVILDDTDWWSGSNPDGTYDYQTGNCTAAGNDQSFTGTGGTGRTGREDSKTASWIKDKKPHCNASRHVLCVCW